MKKINLNNISAYRDIFFVMSIIYIVWHHTNYNISNERINNLRNWGAIGVDFFLFYSGVGLYFSFSKSENIKAFYKRRLIRILPAYLTVAGICYFYTDIICSHSISTFIQNLFFIFYFRWGKTEDWFIVAILIFYVIYPLIYKVLKRLDKIGIVLLLISWLILVVLISVKFDLQYARFFPRVPVFIIGCWFGKYVKLEKKLHIGWIPFFSVFLFSCRFLTLVTNRFGSFTFLERLSYCPIVITTVLLVACIPPNFLKNTTINKVFKKCSGYTLEIYLVHERVLHGLVDLTGNNGYIINVVSIIIAAILAVIVSKWCSFLCSIIEHKKKIKKS